MQPVLQLALGLAVPWNPEAKRQARSQEWEQELALVRALLQEQVLEREPAREQVLELVREPARVREQHSKLLSRAVLHAF